jgi:hypothetical protein
VVLFAPAGERSPWSFKGVPLVLGGISVNHNRFLFFELENENSNPRTGSSRSDRSIVKSSASSKTYRSTTFRGKHLFHSLAF